MAKDPTRGVYYDYDKKIKLANGDIIWVRIYMFDVRNLNIL